MGDPHQAFLIARLPSKDNKGYKCVAALYYNSCYGIEVLSAIRRFITLAEQPDNAEIIREELRRAGESQLKDRFQSRYLGRLLASAYCIGLEEDTICGSSSDLDSGILDVNIGFWDNYTNDGSSIIDITNLDKCAYALIPGPGALPGSEDRCVVMNAEEYATAYAAQEALQDNDDWEFGVQIEYPQPTLPVKLTSEAKAAIASLQNVPLLDGRALPEVWSEDFQLPFPRYRGILRADKPEPLLEDEKDSTSIATPNAIPIVSLLSELALRLVLSQPLDHHSIETLRSMMWLPGKVEAFFEAFRSPQFAPIPDSALALLVDAIGLTYDEDTMNLSRICLSDEQILSLALNAPGVQTLKLSHNPSVSIRTVQAVLTSLPHIKRLVLLNTTISKQEWVSLLQEHPPLFYNLDALVHPCFLDADYGTFPDALTIIGSDEVAIRAKTIPFFSNDTLIQVLSTYLRTLARTLINGSAGTISSTILSADILKPGQTWGSRSISAFAQGNSLPFKGNGWIFIVCTARYQFGFAKVTRKIPNTRKPEASLKDSMAASPADEDLTCDVHDITSFLSELEKEGRPPMPEDAAKRLFDLFANADQRGSFGKNTKLKLISVETANDIVRGKIIEDWPFGIIAREVLPETSTHVDLP